MPGQPQVGERFSFTKSLLNTRWPSTSCNESFSWSSVTIKRALTKSINSQIRGLGAGTGFAQHETITARRGLADKLWEYRHGQEKPAHQEQTGGQESEGPGRARGAEGRQRGKLGRLWLLLLRSLFLRGGRLLKFI